MAERTHSLSTCKIPLSALALYYRRCLEGEPLPERHHSSAIERRHDVHIAIGDVPRDCVVTVAEFAAHTAYLEPGTGTGLFVAPRPDTDVVAPGDWGPDVGRPGTADALSLHAADRAYALQRLARDGWRLLDDERGLIEPAGWTPDARPAVCLSAVRSSARHVLLEDLQYAITALHIAADLRHDW